MDEMVQVCALQQVHLEGVLAIEQDAFPDPWSRRLFLEEIAAAHSLYYAALHGGSLLGYITGWLAADECTINRLAVGRGFREKGVGTALLQNMLEAARGRGASVCHIDVRAGNRAAIAFYAKAGFRQNGLRKKYYSDTREDALLMSLPLEETH